MQKSDPLISPNPTSDERAEDQLDRLAEALRLAVLRAAQVAAQEDPSEMESPPRNTVPSTRRSIETCEWDGKTPASYSEGICAECEEVAEYWSLLLDRAMMDTEDIRAQAVRLITEPATAHPIKVKLAAEVSTAMLPRTITDFETFPTLCLPAALQNSEAGYQQDLDEAYFRLEQYRKHIFPREIQQVLDMEKRYLRRIEQIRQKEIEKLEKTRLEIEIIRDDLRDELEKIRQINENSGKNRKTSVSPLFLTDSMLVHSPEAESLPRELVHLIEGMKWELPSKVKELKGEVRELELRCVAASGLIDEETGNSEAIQQELTAISQRLALLNPRLFGIRRIQTKLAFAQSKLTAQMSRGRLKGTRQTLKELTCSLNALEKVYDRENHALQTESPPPSEPLTYPQSPEKRKNPRQSSTFYTTASSFPGLNDSFISLHIEKNSSSRFGHLFDIIKSQEDVIDNLKKQLGKSEIKIKEMEMKEIQVKEREMMVETREKQVLTLKEYAEMRLNRINNREKRVKLRETAVMSAVAAGDPINAVKVFVLEMRERLETLELSLINEKTALEQRQVKLKFSENALSSKAEYLQRMQRVLTRTHKRQMQEKAYLEVIRHDLNRLLPLLQRCEV